MLEQVSIFLNLVREGCSIDLLIRFYITYLNYDFINPFVTRASLFLFLYDIVLVISGACWSTVSFNLSTTVSHALFACKLFRIDQ